MKVWGKEGEQQKHKQHKKERANISFSRNLERIGRHEIVRSLGQHGHEHSNTGAVRLDVAQQVRVKVEDDEPVDTDEPRDERERHHPVLEPARRPLDPGKELLHERLRVVDEVQRGKVPLRVGALLLGLSLHRPLQHLLRVLLLLLGQLLLDRVLKVPQRLRVDLIVALVLLAAVFVDVEKELEADRFK